MSILQCPRCGEIGRRRDYPTFHPTEHPLYCWECRCEDAGWVAVVEIDARAAAKATSAVSKARTARASRASRASNKARSGAGGRNRNRRSA